MKFHSVCNSKSWRITAPLRWANLQFMRVRQDGIKGRARAFAKKVLRKINHELMLRPVMRQRLIVLGHKLGIYSELRALHHRTVAILSQVELSVLSTGREQMSPRAKQMYLELKDAIERQHKGSD